MAIPRICVLSNCRYFNLMVYMFSMYVLFCMFLLYCCLCGVINDDNIKKAIPGTLVF